MQRLHRLLQTRLLRIPLHQHRPHTTTTATTTSSRCIFSLTPKPPAQKPRMLSPSTAPLVWIDCEMSGLQESDVLLQVACYITSANLELLDDAGINVTISRPKSVLDGMDEWCTRTHGSTGLTAAVLASTTTVAQAEEMLLRYIRAFVPEKGIALLAGNSVHADKEFLKREMPRLVDWLHYRILDVSALKEAARRWCSEDVLRGVPEKRGLHEAGLDIRESIDEARYWRDVVFRPAKGRAE